MHTQSTSNITNITCNRYCIGPELFPLRLISTQENFPRKEKFVKCDWPTQIFRRKKILKLFQLLTMIFSENFLSVEIFLQWKWASRGPARVKLIVAGINELLDSTLILTTKLIDTDIDLDIDMVWITA